MMNSIIYSVLALFWLTYGSSEGSSDFFESSQSKDNWDPSSNFFDDSVVESDTSHKVNQDSMSGMNDRSTRHYSKKDDLRYKAYLIRIINIFLRSSGFEDEAFEDGSQTLSVDLTLSKENLEILQKFGFNEEISLETLENIFRSMFNSKHFFYVKTSVIMEYLKYAILVALLFAILIFSVVMLRKITFKIPSKSVILFIVYISIVLHTLLKQYEDISDNLVMRRMEFDDLGSMPEECNFSKMNFWETLPYIRNFIFRTKDDQCQRFYQSRKSVWYEMDVGSAFIKPFHSIFSALCSMLGEGSEKITKPLIDRSPWPINIMLEILVTTMQLPLLFVGIFLIFFLLTSRNISLKIPYFLSMASEKNPEMNSDFSSKKSVEEVKSRSSEGSAKTYVINHGGVVLLGSEDRKFQSYTQCIQEASYLDLKNHQNTLEKSQPSNSSFSNRELAYSKDIKSDRIFNKQLAIKKKEHIMAYKKLTYFKKMNFKPNKKSVNVKVAKENLNDLPQYFDSQIF